MEFHGKYYHPSNSYIYLYGNLDAEEYLTFLEENYLKDFDSLTIDSEIRQQEPFAEKREIVKEYSIMEDEHVRENTYLTYNVSMGSSLDRKLYAAMDILDYVLCSAPGTPVKQALIDAGIGKDVYSTMENGIAQPYFSIVAKNADEDQKEAFVSVIEDTLKKLVEEGFVHGWDDPRMPTVAGLRNRGCQLLYLQIQRRGFWLLSERTDAWSAGNGQLAV